MPIKLIEEDKATHSFFSMDAYLDRVARGIKRILDDHYPLEDPEFIGEHVLPTILSIHYPSIANRVTIHLSYTFYNSYEGEWSVEVCWRR